MLLPLTDLLLRVPADAIPTAFHAALIETITDAIEAHLDELVDHPASGGGYFLSPWTQTIEPLNHAHLLAAAAAEAFAVTGDARFRTLAEKVYAFFRWNWFHEENGTVSWSYIPAPDDPKNDHPVMRFGETPYRQLVGAEFAHKAAVTIELPVPMFRAGLIPAADLVAIAGSIRTNVFLGEDKVNLNIGPRKLRLCDDTPFADLPQIRPHFWCSFDMLAPFDAAMAGTITTIVENRADLFPDGWFTGSAAILALSRRIAAAR